MYKISKADVQYSIGHADSHCGKSFDTDQGILSLVHRTAVIGNSARAMSEGRWRN
jgi:hypothetical protein